MDINLQPFLEDDLVTLEPLLNSDFEVLYKIASDPLIWEQHQDNQRYTLEGFTNFFERAMQSRAALKILSKEGKEVIGSSRYKLISQKEGVVEIGWTFIARKYWGGKYNRAIKRLMINHALVHFKKVVFYVNEKNTRSRRAMEKLGGILIDNGQASWTLDKNSDGVTYLIDTKLVS